MTSEAELPIEPDEASQDELDGPLPEAVRARVVALAADAVGRVPADQLPASLKRVAAFAPARRAKLAGSQIASVLGTDPSFRERLATQIRAQIPEFAHALESGTPPAAADPVEMAAVAYLLRPEGWTGIIERAVELADTEHAAAASRQAAEQLDRLRHRLDVATAELREAKERHRHEVATLKSENADLRHKLGDARLRAKSSERLASEARSREEELAAAVSSAAAAGEADARRLRARIEELERDLASARRSERSTKDEGTLRARLLLDTLLDSAQGLRRELALPAVEGAPADAVQADIAGQGARASAGTKSMAVDDPALLDELLNLPRVHLIVDGYNVTKHAWPETSLETQRDRLLGGLAALVARSGADVTVVFDAADKTHRPLVNRPRGVRVLYSPVGVIADDVIRQLVAAEPGGRPLVVVSSDQEVVRDVVNAGARSVAAPALSRLLARA